MSGKKSNIDFFKVNTPCHSTLMLYDYIYVLPYIATFCQPGQQAIRFWKDNGKQARAFMNLYLSLRYTIYTMVL